MDQEREIALEVGRIVVSNEVGIKKYNLREIEAFGREWLIRNRKKICEAISNERVRRALHPETKADQQLQILVDALAALGLGVPPIVLARAIQVLGEDWFCGPKTK